MDWKHLLTTKRFGMERYHDEKHDGRTEFQRDYDRLIFSPAFRRLQNKTQVFPLPGSVFVHNRLTHSLEVACVGRSLGFAVSSALKEKYGQSYPHLSEIGSIVAAACLAHDLGNPPFGHSGEKAIATFFSEGNTYAIRSQLADSEWSDFVNFEGNANAFRLLTTQFRGRRVGGFALTYSTLASIVKYPYESQFADQKKSKFGFFQSEKQSFEVLASELGLIKSPKDSNRYARHPLVYLVEAADDICYQVMDIEDAFKLRLLSFEETRQILLSFLSEDRQRRANEIFSLVTDRNEQIAYLRSSVIGTLIDACAKVFVENEEKILSGEFEKSLIDNIEEDLALVYKNTSSIAFKRVYTSQVVLDVELAGFKIIKELLETVIDAVLSPEKAYSKQILNRIPQQYNIYSESVYEKIQAVLDFVSGTTDVYALDLYRKINGMSLPDL